MFVICVHPCPSVAQSFLSRPFRSFASYLSWSTRRLKAVQLVEFLMQVPNERFRRERFARDDFHQSLRPELFPAPMNLFIQPVFEQTEFAAGETRGQLRDLAAGRGEELSGIHIPQRVRRKIPDHPTAP